VIEIKKNFLNWIFVGFISLSVFLAIFYLAGEKDSGNETSSATVSIRKPIIPSKIAKDNGQQPVTNVKKQTPKIPQHEPVAKNANEKHDRINRQEDFLENKDTVAGVGLTVEELKSLHAQQLSEMSNNSSARVIGYTVAGNEDITFEQLKLLHEKQSQEIESNNDWNEIVVPDAGNDDTGLTRSEVAKLHEEQKSNWVNADDWDEIHPLESEQNYSTLTIGKMIMIQDEQDYAVWENIDNQHQSAAPSPEEGGTGMTVQEIKDLQLRQLKK